MTTNVTINAHCDEETTEVVVVIYEGGFPIVESERFFLQDGDTAERVVYDGKHIMIGERPKS